MNQTIKNFLTKQASEMIKPNPGQKRSEVILGYLGILSGFIAAASMSKSLLKVIKSRR